MQVLGACGPGFLTILLCKFPHYGDIYQSPFGAVMWLCALVFSPHFIPSTITINIGLHMQYKIKYSKTEQMDGVPFCSGLVLSLSTA